MLRVTSKAMATAASSPRAATVRITVRVCRTSTSIADSDCSSISVHEMLPWPGGRMRVNTCSACGRSADAYSVPAASPRISAASWGRSLLSVAACSSRRWAKRRAGCGCSR